MTTPITTMTAVETIADTLRGVISGIINADTAIGAMKDAREAAIDTDASNREDLLDKLAAMSQASQWSAKDVDQGAALAAGGKDEKLPQSIKAFAADCRAVMQPGTRMHFPAIRAAAITVWENETLALNLDKKTAVAPAHKAWKRRYHTVMRAVHALGEHGRTLDTPELVTEYAFEQDPDFNPKKVAAQIKTVRDILSTIYANFQIADAHNAFDDLDGVNEETLTAALAARSTNRKVVGGSDAPRVLAAERDEAKAEAVTTPTVVAPSAPSVTDILDPPKPAPTLPVNTLTTTPQGATPAVGVVSISVIPSPFSGSAARVAA